MDSPCMSTVYSRFAISVVMNPNIYHCSDPARLIDWQALGRCFPGWGKHDLMAVPLKPTLGTDSSGEVSS